MSPYKKGFHAQKAHNLLNCLILFQAASKQGKIYIGKFKDPTISEDVIREHFTQYGQVVEIQRPVDRSKNSEPKNFCFVTFDKEEPANALLKKVNMHYDFSVWIAGM